MKIGHGRDYDDVPPLRGVFAGTVHHDLDVTVDIRRMTATAPAPPTPRGPDLARLTLRDEEAAMRRAEQDRHQQQQQQAPQ